MSQPMKTCAFCEQPKPTSAFGRNRVNFRWGAKDGLTIYCKACLNSGKSLKRVTNVEALKPKFERHHGLAVLKAVRDGKHTREAIHETTGLDMDEVVDLLAHLAFDKQRLRIVKVGEEREFHLAA